MVAGIGEEGGELFVGYGDGEGKAVAAMLTVALMEGENAAGIIGIIRNVNGGDSESSELDGDVARLLAVRLGLGNARLFTTPRSGAMMAGGSSELKEEA